MIDRRKTASPLAMISSAALVAPENDFVRSFFHALFACLLFVLACDAAHARPVPRAGADPPESNVPLVQDILQRPLPADRLGRDTLAHALAMIGFKQHAASLRAFDAAQAIARLLRQTVPQGATVGDAIRVIDGDSTLLPKLQRKLATDAIAIDFRTPLGVAQIDADATVSPPHGMPKSLAQYGLAGATLVQPGIWRAHDGTTVDGHAFPDKLFIRGIVNSRIASDAVVDITFDLSGNEPAKRTRLSCANQTVLADSEGPLYCGLNRSFTAPIDDAAAIALLDSLQHGTLIPLPAQFAVSTGSPRRTYWSTGNGEDVGPNDAEHNADFSARMAAIAMLKQAGCTQKADCAKRTLAALGNAGYLKITILLAVMTFFAIWRWRSKSAPAPMLAFTRVIFALYSIFVVIALVLSVVDSPSACKGAGMCGMLDALVNIAAALPWSYWLLGTQGALESASDQQTMALLWVFITVNLVWLGFMAFYGRRAVDPRR